MKNPGTRRTTLKDIAREVGMSFTSVSRILRGDPLFNEKTIRKVQQQARKLKYRPNIMARALVSRGNSMIGLVLRDIQHSFYVDIIAGVQEELEPRGYSIILGNSSLDPIDEKRHLKILADKLAEGIIITPISAGAVNRQAYREAQNLGMPLVMIGNPKAGVKAPFVKVDNVLGGQLAAKYLIDLGHRDFVYLTCGQDELRHHKSTHKSENIERFEGFHQVLREHDLAERCFVAEAANSIVTGHTIGQILSIRPRPTAIFVYSDMISFQLIRMLLERGVRIPYDFSIVGYDDIETASLVTPPLTTIAQPKKDMGKLAALKMIDMLEGKPAGGTILTPILVIRESASRPARPESD
ncbi:MAG: LacI family DNA-binding transcriptional regulator [bacterium]|nr:LacI family DNA-binding transcriptional regulator [Candidatus Sumerlaeota bacterium]